MEVIYTQTINQVEDLKEIGAFIVSKLSEFPVVLLEAPMGAGKTTFIKACCDLLGCSDVTNSPTFSIINEYKTSQGNLIYHLDLYRLESLQQVSEIGVEEVLYSGNPVFIEWPQLIEPFISLPFLKIKIEVFDNLRYFRIFKS